MDIDSNLQSGFDRRLFLKVLGAAALWGVLPGCRNGKAAPLVMAAHIWPGYEFMFLAQREGWLDTQQVVLREMASSSESLKALNEGSIDAAALTLDEVLRARAAGAHLSVVLVFDISAGADVMLARPGIRQLRDIRGKRVGFEQGALGSLMLAEALQAAGLQRGDVRAVPLTIDQQDAAWRRGEVDVLVSYPPVSSKLLAEGAVNLFDSRQLPDTIVDVLAVRREVLDEKGGAVRHLVGAHLHALQQMSHNPQDTAFRIAHHLGLTPVEVRSAFRGMVLPDADNNRRLLGGEKPALLAGARRLNEAMFREGALPQPDSLEGLLRADFLSGGENG